MLINYFGCDRNERKAVRGGFSRYVYQYCPEVRESGGFKKQRERLEGPRQGTGQEGQVARRVRKILEEGGAKRVENHYALTGGVRRMGRRVCPNFARKFIGGLGRGLVYKAVRCAERVLNGGGKAMFYRNLRMVPSKKRVLDAAYVDITVEGGRETARALVKGMIGKGGRNGGGRGMLTIIRAKRAKRRCMRDHMKKGGQKVHELIQNPGVCKCSEYRAKFGSEHFVTLGEELHLCTTVERALSERYATSVRLAPTEGEVVAKNKRAARKLGRRMGIWKGEETEEQIIAGSTQKDQKARARTCATTEKYSPLLREMAGDEMLFFDEVDKVRWDTSMTCARVMKLLYERHLKKNYKEAKGQLRENSGFWDFRKFAREAEVNLQKEHKWPFLRLTIKGKFFRERGPGAVPATEVKTRPITSYRGHYARRLLGIVGRCANKLVNEAKAGTVLASTKEVLQKLDDYNDGRIKSAILLAKAEGVTTEEALDRLPETRCATGDIKNFFTEMRTEDAMK